MSSVRMCDECGAIFSEREEDWQTGSIFTIRKNGASVQVQQDRCPGCAVGAPDRPAIQPHLDRTRSLERSIDRLENITHEEGG